jgi:hypothetical protein
MSQHQTIGQNYNTKVDNKSLKNVAEFNYLWTMIESQNCILEEIKTSLNSGNTCYNAVQNLLSSCV